MLESEACDWECIYLELTSEESQEATPALFDRKRLAHLLSKDEYLDWKSALYQPDPLLLDYIKQSIHLDRDKDDVTLHNTKNATQNILQKFRKVIGGKYLMRQDLGLSADEEKVVQKQLVSNSEAEMCEFLYDIKLYQIQQRSDKDIVAYQLEVYSLADPDVVF